MDLTDKELFNLIRELFPQLWLKYKKSKTVINVVNEVRSSTVCEPETELRNREERGISSEGLPKLNKGRSKLPTGSVLNSKVEVFYYLVAELMRLSGDEELDLCQQAISVLNGKSKVTNTLSSDLTCYARSKLRYLVRDLSA